MVLETVYSKILLLLDVFHMVFYSLIVVIASFDKLVYSFSESAGQSSGIAVDLSIQIARDLSVSIYAGIYSIFVFAMLTSSQHNLL